MSLTGTLMKVDGGPNTTSLQIRVDGAQFTCISKIRKTLKTRFSLGENLTVPILSPIEVDPSQTTSNREYEQ